MFRSPAPFCRFALYLGALPVLCHPDLRAQATPVLSPAVPGHYIVVYRNAAAATQGGARLRSAGATRISAQASLGTAAFRGSAETVRSVAADPEVETVLADRMVYAQALLTRPLSARGDGTVTVRAAGPLKSVRVDPLAPAGSAPGGPVNQPAPTDTYYTGSPQGWAVRAAGGYGSGVLGGTVAGPWNRTRGTGVRIAVLDSGVDLSHPDLAPNIGLNLSEIDTAAQPSPCDDGTPQDQTGHGTWVASLAAGAEGDGTGRVVGVAPAATLLNLKVLQRVPGSGASVASRCAAGQAAGLVSWLLKGIDDAVQQHADVIVLSLGSIVDLYTGDGAGLKSLFDRATHAAAAAGVLIVAAAGNEAFDLGNPRYLQLPAQARDVLAVVASTNAACAENVRAGAVCAAGAITLPYYSNYGAPLGAIAAPGGSYPAGADEEISGWVRGACSTGKPGTADGLPADAGHSFGCFNLGHIAYVQAMGTSASAALAGGAAALVRAAHPGWSPAAVANALRQSATGAAGGSALLDTAAAMDFQQ